MGYLTVFESDATKKTQTASPVRAEMLPSISTALFSGAEPLQQEKSISMHVLVCTRKSFPCLSFPSETEVAQWSACAPCCVGASAVGLVVFLVMAFLSFRGIHMEKDGNDSSDSAIGWTAFQQFVPVILRTRKGVQTHCHIESALQCL